jgi:hypothetical protein
MTAPRNQKDGKDENVEASADQAIPIPTIMMKKVIVVNFALLPTAFRVWRPRQFLTLKPRDVSALGSRGQF